MIAIDSRLIQKVMVGYDGTESSERALEFVLSLVEASAPKSCEIHLVYAVDRPSGIPDPVPDEVMESLKRAGQDILSDAARTIRKKFETPTAHLEFGSPAEKILETADRVKPDLIVIGIAKHPASERILGTVSSLLFKRRSYPVLGVP